MELNLSLDAIVKIITIISFGAAVVNYVVIRPLQNSIGTLKEALNKLDSLLNEVQKKEIVLEERVAHVEESAKSAHKRIDSIEKTNIRKR